MGLGWRRGLGNSLIKHAEYILRKTVSQLLRYKNVLYLNKTLEAPLKFVQPDYLKLTTQVSCLTRKFIQNKNIIILERSPQVYKQDREQIAVMCSTYINMNAQKYMTALILQSNGKNT